jgi:hypothetical protein
MNEYLKNANVAVGLFGIHYLETLNHWMGWTPRVDYTTVLENNKKYLFSKFNPIFFSATYFSPKLQNLIDDFNFYSLKLKTVKNDKPTAISESFRIRNTIFLDTIKLILESDKSFDYVLLTRYDLFFKYSPLKDIHKDKINLICRAKWGSDDTLVDDNFYFMPYKKLDSFYNIVSSIPITITSHKYGHFFPENELFYVTAGTYYSHEIPVYYVERNG